jgi:hypothetical protein
MDADVIKLLIPLTAIVLGSLMLLIPIAGWTARFAIKPIMEALGRAREGAGSNARELSILEQRVALLEQHHRALEDSIERLQDVKEFEKRLAAPPKAE